jgi:hypothetical protein
MATQIDLGGIPVDVVLKDIKNIHLSVHPPAGRVRIAAPLRMNLETIRIFAISKLGWVKQQQKKLREQERESPREYLERESHYVWGRRYLLRLVEHDGPPKIELRHAKMYFSGRLNLSDARRQSIVEDWYRTQLKEAIPPLIEKWQRLMGVKVRSFQVRRMRTKEAVPNFVFIDFARRY